MAYGEPTVSKKTKTDSEDLNKHLRLDTNLDNDTKSVKVGDELTPLDISKDKVNYKGKEIATIDDTAFHSDFDALETISGDSSAMTIDVDTVTVAGGGLILNAVLNSDGCAELKILPDNGEDSGLFLYNASAGKWYIANDADDSDTFKIGTGYTVGSAVMIDMDTSGNVTLTGDLAVNGDTITTDGNMDLDSGGSLTLDAHDGNFIASKAGTEFSSASSAYAGMIIGYRMIGEDAVAASYTLTTSFAVPNADMTVRFVAPPSGCVEVMVQVYIDQLTTRRNIIFGLSDNATYNTIGNTYEHKVMSTDDRENDTVLQNNWTITGLTAGTTYNYWFGAKISSTSGFLRWGGTSAEENTDFIMKVTALPTAVSDFAEYD